MPNYIVKRDENVNNSRTSRDIKKRIAEMDSARDFTSTMRFRKKLETQKFSSFKGGARGDHGRNLKK